MNVNLLNIHIPIGTKLVKRIESGVVQAGLASKLKEIECDNFSRKKLPVQNCAGSFCINKDFKKAIKGVDFYSFDIKPSLLFNKVKIKAMPVLEKSINLLLKEIPGFGRIFKPKQQYGEGLDKHVFTTFQKLLLNPEYKKLNHKERKVLEIATLLHDMGKVETLGSRHPEFSTKISEKILKNKAIETKEKALILKLIRHHHYSENIAKGKMSYDDYAKILDSNEFRLLKILIDSDIRSKRKPVSNRLQENVIFFMQQDNVIRLNRAEKTPSLNLLG